MWPVYLVTLHLAVLWVIFTLHVGHVPSPDVGQLTAISYVRQILLVQLWFQPFFDGSSWDGPAWSISAEWLAYLLFGLLVLVIFRVAHATRARTLMGLALRRLAAAHGAVAGQRPFLHAVELAAADRRRSSPRGAGRCRGPQAAADRPGSPRAPGIFPCCSSSRSSASSTCSTRIRCPGSSTAAGWSTCCSFRWW